MGTLYKVVVNEVRPIVSAVTSGDAAKMPAVRDEQHLSAPGEQNQQVQPTIAQRLAKRRRIFFEGPANLSQRGTRKNNAYSVMDERAEERK